MPATPLKPVPLAFKPGIKRDGTITEGDMYTDGQWTRFNALGKPRKMGGYRKIRDNTGGPVYGCFVHATSNVAYIYTSYSDGVEVQPINMSGVITGGTTTRTPVGFSSSSSNVGQFDVMFDSASASDVILFHSAPNLNDIASRETRNVYYGPVTGTGVLTNTGAPAVSGGVCSLYPYAFVYGDDGYIAWSVAGQPATWSGGDSGSARVAGTKIIKGVRVRGADGAAPAGLFFTLDSVVRASYVGGTPVFAFNTLANDLSPLSSRGVINWGDGTVMWPASDRFMTYNGAVRDLPNNLNLNYFFDAVKCAQRQSVWGTMIPRWGEAWWFYPRNGATYPTHAIVHNKWLNTWYDTPLPEGGRSDGFFPAVFRFPIWVGVEASSTSKYTLWQQEYRSGGVNIYDKIADGNTSAVDAFYTTGDISLLVSGSNRNVRLSRVEIDANQAEDMTVEVLSRPYPRGTDSVLRTATFNQDVAVVDAVRSQGRFMRLRFRSNVAGGFFEQGESVVQLQPGDERPVGA